MCRNLFLFIFHKQKAGAVVAQTSFVYSFFIDQSGPASYPIYEKSCFIYFVHFPDYLQH